MPVRVSLKGEGGNRCGGLILQSNTLYHAIEKKEMKLYKKKEHLWELPTLKKINNLNNFKKFCIPSPCVSFSAGEWQPALTIYFGITLY